MKKLIIAILVLLLIALGTFIFKRVTGDSVISDESVIGKGMEKIAELAPDTMVAKMSDNVPPALEKLPGDTALAMVLPAKAVAPAVLHLAAFTEKVKTSALGKKMKLDQMIDQGLEAAKSQAEGNPLEASAASAFDFKQAAALFSDFEKLELVIRNKSLEGKFTPLLKLVASFKTETYPKLAQSQIDAGLKDFEGMPDAPITKDAKEAGAYAVNAKPPLAPIEILGRVKTSGKEVNVALSAIGGANSAPTPAAADMKADVTLPPASLSKDSLSSYFHAANIQGLVDGVVAIVPSEGDKEEVRMFKKAMDQTFGQFVSAAGSALFSEDFQSKSCTSFKPDSALLLPWKTAIKSNSSKNSQFSKLVGPRTTLAFRVDGALAAAYSQQMMQSVALQSQFASSAAGDGTAEDAVAVDPAQQMENFLKQAEVVSKELARVKIKDVGILGNAPTVSFIPDVAVYLEHEGGVTLETFADALKNIYSKLAPPSAGGEVPFTIGKSASGETTLSFPAFDGYQLVFYNLNDTAFLGTIQETFVAEAKAQLASAEVYLDDAKLKSKGINSELGDSDTFAYLSTSSLMPLARQFAPFITMSQPELKITDAELTQFLDLFDFNLLLTGKNSLPSENILCSAARGVVY